MNPEHVEALAFHPVRAAVHQRQRRAVVDARPELCLQHQRDAVFEVIHASDHLEALLFPVNRREEVEEAAADGVLRVTRDLFPSRGGHVDDHRDAGRDLDAKRRSERSARLLWVHQSTFSLGGAFLPVFLKCAIWSCRSNRPLSSDSGGGGQPGTYTSTGMTRSTPFTT